MDKPLTLEAVDYDGVVSALAGNGELCTTVGPTGFHRRPASGLTEPALATQRFAWAGRRLRGPRHVLVDFGSLERRMMVDGRPCDDDDWTQALDYEAGLVRSELRHGDIVERTVSCVALEDNAFVAHTRIENGGETPRALRWNLRYAFAEPGAALTASLDGGAVQIEYRVEDHLGFARLGCDALEGCGPALRTEERGATAEIECVLPPGGSVAFRSWLQLSDRTHYAFPFGPEDIPEVERRHAEGWERFWQRSEVVTGDPMVDAFRASSLYTLRCQATPWSVPPALAEQYWGAGAFHDEMYPFFGWLSANHAELARRMPYFRLTTLPRAVLRARSRGALYPWSSTEDGEERDPNGLWLTERFHLGQLAVCIWHLWLYERDREQLEDLYPVLREVARYYEWNMLERDRAGRLQTRACVDFDESVGAVTNGPFTVCAAIASLRFAARAAAELGVDAERAARWQSLAIELSGNLPGADSDPAEGYAIPEGKPLHYSVLGPVFPFSVDAGSHRARASAARIHAVCRSSMGWKPGLSETFEGHTWMWAAGHLGIVHAMLGDAARAWDAVRGGPMSAGPFLSPNEHRNAAGIVQVPWFTTGCGGWLYALHALFVQVDEEGSRLFPAAGTALASARFRGLRADRGVTVAARLADGRLAGLQAEAPCAMSWAYRIPAGVVGPRPLRGAVKEDHDGWLRVAARLQAGTNDLLA